MIQLKQNVKEQPLLKVAGRRLKKVALRFAARSSEIPNSETGDGF
jgi:hypothetical protein